VSTKGNCKPVPQWNKRIQPLQITLGPGTAFWLLDYGIVPVPGTGSSDLARPRAGAVS
jgi:hypothetical protein